jgi:hypothetical protein
MPNVDAIRKRLNYEGYASHLMEGPTLKKQLKALIEEAGNERTGG